MAGHLFGQNGKCRCGVEWNHYAWLEDCPLDESSGPRREYRAPPTPSYQIRNEGVEAQENDLGDNHLYVEHFVDSPDDDELEREAYDQEPLEAAWRVLVWPPRRRATRR